MAEMLDRTPMGLIDALCERVNNLLKDSFWLKSEFSKSNSENEIDENTEFLSPHVHAQYLPTSLTENKERDKTKDYPIVLIMCLDGTIADLTAARFGSTLKINFYFGVWDNNTDNQGWRLAMSMAWQVMQNLMSNKNCNGFILDTPVKWSPATNREPPYYAATLETTWKGSVPSVEVLDESFIEVEERSINNEEVEDEL